MIYEYPDFNQPIRQGDIFYPIPLTQLALDKMVILTNGGFFEEADWLSLKDKEVIVAQVAIKPTWGIVATQDCDAIHAPVISFFEIRTFQEVSGLTLPTSAKKWVSIITQKSRLNVRWFYLPADEQIGFTERMACDFHVVLQGYREDLEKLINLRRGRLNEVAFQHYRESITQYFRRYPYDEWYPLTKEEFDEYNREKGPVKPFEWRK